MARGAQDLVVKLSPLHGETIITESGVFQELCFGNKIRENLFELKNQ